MVNKIKDTTTEEKILEAARKVFIERGLDGARMQEIADKAGINKALLHYYFRSKEKLFEVIFKETAGNLFPKFEMILNSDKPLFHKIDEIVSNYIDLIIKNPYLPLFVLSEMNKSRNLQLANFFEMQRNKFVEKFVKNIEREIKRGVIKKISPAHLIINIFSLCAFPFIAKPVIGILLEIDDLQFKYMMEQRKKIVTDFIIASIKK